MPTCSRIGSRFDVSAAKNAYSGTTAPGRFMIYRLGPTLTSDFDEVEARATLLSQSR